MHPRYILLVATSSLAQFIAAQGVAPSESFGNQGLIVLDIPSTPPDLFIFDMDPTPDGGLVMAGAKTHNGSIRYFLARFASDGSPDADYGTNGQFISPASFGPLNGRVAAVRPDGGVLIAGFYSANGSYQLTTMRVDPSGQTDQSFGDNGLTVLESNVEISPGDITLAPDGSAYIAGGIGGYGCVIHILEDGGLDTDFGNDGLVILASPTGHPLFAGRIRYAPSGYLIVAGTHAEDVVDAGFIAALDLSGSPVGWFGDQGHLELDLVAGGQENWKELLVKEDGSIVLTGSAYVNGPPGKCVVLCLNSDGSTDHAFGTNGFAEFLDPANSSRTAPIPYSMSDDGLVLTGIQASSSGVLCKLYVTRLRADGSLDVAFGNNGTYLDSPPQYSITMRNMGARLVDGRVVVAGYGFHANEYGYGAMAYEVSDLATPVEPAAIVPSGPMLFPNPTTGSITVRGQQAFGTGPILLSDASGRVVQEWPGNDAVRERTLHLNTSLSDGHYVLHLPAEAGMLPRPVLLQR